MTITVTITVYTFIWSHVANMKHIPIIHCQLLTINVYDVFGAYYKWNETETEMARCMSHTGVNLKPCVMCSMSAE